jgi:hypothetical protein
VYMDDDITLSVGFSRFMGDVELILLCSSFYEYCDLRVYLIQIMGGFERFIYPERFESVIIIPPELYNYEYVNEVTGVSHKLNWDKINLQSKLIETTNKNEWVIPVVIKPILKLSSLSDSSTKYGGDQLAEWKLSASISFEVEIPSFLCIESDKLLKKIDINLGFSGQFTKYPEIPNNPIYMGVDPKTGEVKQSTTKKIEDTKESVSSVNEPKNHVDLKPTDTQATITTSSNTQKKTTIPLPPMTPPEFRPVKLTDNNPTFNQNSNVSINQVNSDSDKYLSDISTDSIQIKVNTNNIIDPDSNEVIIPIVSDIERVANKIFKKRYVHIVTLAQAESSTDWKFYSPEIIDDLDLLILNSRFGRMKLNDHFKVINNGTEIEIIHSVVNLMENDMIEIYVYQYDN